MSVGIGGREGADRAWLGVEAERSGQLGAREGHLDGSLHYTRGRGEREKVAQSLSLSRLASDQRTSRAQAIRVQSYTDCHTCACEALCPPVQPVSARSPSPVRIESPHSTTLPRVQHTSQQSRAEPPNYADQSTLDATRTTSADRMVKVADIGKLLLLALTHPGEARSLITYKVSPLPPSKPWGQS